MQSQIISHSADLKQLRDEGFDIRINHGHLFVYDIPYVNESKEVKFGTLITVLNRKQETT